MVYEGARGETLTQMSQTLGFDTNQLRLATEFGQLQSGLEADQRSNALVLDIANALWVEEGHFFEPAFLQAASNSFQAAVNEADFVNNADGTTQDINNWVSQNTQGKIQNIVGPGVINPDTVLVLANAIYFFGAWTESFAVTNTQVANFYPSSSTQQPVSLMHQPAPASGPVEGIPFNYMAATGTNGYQAIEVPYASNEVSMLILLPSQVDGLAELEQELSPGFLSNVLARLTPRIVDLWMPRFTVSASLDLGALLAQMGMPDAFGGAADFSGIDGARDLSISHVLHKAWVDVTETGTEAAAATVVSTTTAIGPPPPPNPVFRADHPFLFFIIDNKTGSVLFAGRLVNPSPPALPPAPPLTMSLQANNLKISWPYPSTGWSLQQAGDLTRWTPAHSSTDGTNIFVNVTPSGNCMFFRLSYQQ